MVCRLYMCIVESEIAIFALVPVLRYVEKLNSIDEKKPVCRLIPTVPLRLNYILWIEDLINKKSDVTGIDIGTGATCVYPLLAAKKNKWKFLATEADEMSFTWAKHNVDRNSLQAEITGACHSSVHALCFEY